MAQGRADDGHSESAREVRAKLTGYNDRVLEVDLLPYLLSGKRLFA
ncbi:MAG: hypothetical protein WDN29_04305 [Methylovirgula sp.]